MFQVSMFKSIFASKAPKKYTNLFASKNNLQPIQRAYVITLFYSCNLSMFQTSSSLASLSSRVWCLRLRRSLPMWAPFRCLPLGSRLLTLPANIKRDCEGLLGQTLYLVRRSLNYGRKKFYSIDPWCHVKNIIHHQWSRQISLGMSLARTYGHPNLSSFTCNADNSCHGQRL